MVVEDPLSACTWTHGNDSAWRSHLEEYFGQQEGGFGKEWTGHEEYVGRFGGIDDGQWAA